MISKSEKVATAKQTFYENRKRRRRTRNKRKKIRIWLAVILFFTLFLMIVYCSDNTCKARIDSNEQIPYADPVELMMSDGDADEDFENEKIESALYENGYFRSDVPLDGETQALLHAACEEAGITYELALAVIRKETEFQNVMGDNGNSYGYMQIQPRWHEDRMERLGVTDLTDPYSNFRVGCDFLAELLSKYTLEEALTAYNSGKPGKSEYAASVMNYMEEYNCTGGEDKHENYT